MGDGTERRRDWLYERVRRYDAGDLAGGDRWEFERRLADLADRLGLSTDGLLAELRADLSHEDDLGE